MPRSTRPPRWLAAVLTILILALVLVVGYRRQAAEDDDARAAARGVGARSGAGVPDLGPGPMTIVPGIHLLGGLALAAAYVVETSEGLVLIDTGLSGDARLLKKQMASLELDWRRVRAILLTHVHGDHSGGAQQLRAATGAKVYAGQGDAAVLRAGRPREAFFSAFPMPLDMTPAPTTVDVELSGREVIAMGDVHFRAIATPGHTPGSICYLMERGHQQVLFSGDVIQSLSGDDQSRSKLLRPLGTYVAYLAPRYRGNAEAFLSTLRLLRAMPAPQLVLPGHPRMDPEPPDPTMSQLRWEALLDAGIRDMEQLQARYAHDGANFLDGVPKKLLPDLYYLGEFKEVAVYAFFVKSKLFVVNAPGRLGLFDFLNARLQQLGLKPAAPTAALLTSGNAEETAGLAELVEKCHCQVVASPAAWRIVKATCPAATTFLPAADLPHKGWFEVKPIPLTGGVGPVAYLVPWADKAVLFSGRIPIKATLGNVKELYFSQTPENIRDYRAALQRLGDLKPNLWLPAFPADNQNAYLYDNEWEEVLAENRKLLH